MRALPFLLVSLYSSSAWVLPGAPLVTKSPTCRSTPSVILQEDAGRYADAEERGRAALEAMKAETTEAAKKQAALEDMAADAEAAGPFNPVLALAALLGGVVLGFIVNS